LLYLNKPTNSPGLSSVESHFPRQGIPGRSADSVAGNPAQCP